MSSPDKARENPQQIPLLTLNGERIEGLYQLGLAESKIYLENLEMLEHLVQTRSPLLNSWLRGLGQKLLQKTGKHSQSAAQFGAYAQGLGLSQTRLQLAYFLPELASSLSKWLPGLPISLLGCSSFLTWSESADAPLHGRILDFPLAGSFDKYERILVTRFKGELAVASLSSAGLPFHSLSAINEAGVTFSLHQKFTPTLNFAGESIFTLASDLISKVENERDLFNLLKSKSTITTWNLIFTFPNGKAASIDFSAKEANILKFDLKEKGEYLCNINQASYPNPELLVPTGIHSYNHMRKLTGHKKLANIDPAKIDEKKLLKTLSALKLKKGTSAKNFNLDCLTPSSLHAVVMNAKEGTMHFNIGSAPKVYRDSYGVLSANLTAPKKAPLLEVKGKLKAPTLAVRGYRYLILAQRSYDHFDKHLFYHQLQMAIACFVGLEIKVVAEFFLTVAFFLDTNHSKERHILLSKLIELQTKLPPYLSELCALFIHRLERLMGVTSKIDSTYFNNQALLAIFKAEAKIPAPILYEMLKKTAVIRLDLLDVIQPHVKLSSNASF